jgi:Ser/Thr protein kinase RdoA (MazF antagonist)
MRNVRGAHFQDLSWRSQVRQLRRIAARVLPLYGLEDASFRLLKYQDNAVFRVSGPGKAILVLRVSRVEKVAPAEALSVLLWLQALRSDLGIHVPQPIPARSGSLVTALDEANCCLLTWVPGTLLRRHLTVGNVATAGEITARLHRHSREWRRPAGFQRPVWDIDWLAGPDSVLWNPPALPFIDDRAVSILATATDRVARLVRQFGNGPEVLGLTHADVHFGNFVVEKEVLGLIDFDDCSIGYYLHDLATMLNPLRRLSEGPVLAAAYLQGYERQQDLPYGAGELLPTFLAFRELLDMKVALDSKNARVLARRPAWVGNAVERLEEYLDGKLDDEVAAWRQG